MIVAAETNFVLELAFRQREVHECERLIELAARQSIDLVIPACSLFEPYETLIRRQKERTSALGSFKREVNELARSDYYRDLARKAKIVVEPITESSRVYRASLHDAVASILRVATIIPLSARVMSHALTFPEDWKLSPQDAVVVASVELFMREHSDDLKLFANKNLRDFVRGSVIAHFQQCDCRILGSFTAARQLSEASLTS